MEKPSGPSDLDPRETNDWLDSLDSVIANEGYERAHFLLEALFDKARRAGGNAPFSPNTAYLNTIPTHLEAKSPGDHAMEHKLRSYVRWNAAMMVLRGGKKISNWADIFRPSPPQPPCTTLASITSGTRRRPIMVVIWCTSRATALPVFMRARSCSIG